MSGVCPISGHLAEMTAPEHDPEKWVPVFR